jgi:hypothetical protein
MTEPEKPEAEPAREYVCPACLRVFYVAGKLTAHQVGAHPQVYA